MNIKITRTNGTSMLVSGDEVGITAAIAHETDCDVVELTDDEIAAERAALRAALPAYVPLGG